MKKFILLLTLILFSGVAAFGQDVDVPADWADIVVHINDWFGSLAGIAGITVFLAGFLNTILKVEKKFIKQLVAFAVAVGLTLGSSLLNFGFFAEALWYQALLYGLGAGLISNGFYDVTTVRALLKFIRIG